MPTIKDSLYFNYDGTSCRTYNLMNVNVDSGGMLQEIFVASRTINETKVKGSDTPIFDSVDEDPLQFTINLAFTTEQWDDSDIDNIVVWLFQDVYKPLYFEDKPDRIYQCMPIGDASIFHNGLKQGYIQLTMRCKSSRILSPQQLTSKVDLSTNTGTYNTTLTNNGHVDIYPEISFTKVNDGNVVFTKNGQILEIDNLKNGENIYIDCGRQIIETDAVGIYHYGDVIGHFLDIVLNRGDNTIGIQGTIKDLQFRYVYKYKF